ncbi:hypothetical protein [Streptomyces sp. C]|nr:hypothetical protein [Streptomyces sp. C]
MTAQTAQTAQTAVDDAERILLPVVDGSATHPEWAERKARG